MYRLDLIRTPGVLDRDDLNAGFVYRFHLAGNFVLDVAEEFNVLVHTLVAGGMKKVVFDLSELKYIDSTGIGAFLGLAKQLRSKAGDLVFFEVSPALVEIFQLVRLQDVIPFFRAEKQITDHFFPPRV